MYCCERLLFLSKSLRKKQTCFELKTELIMTSPAPPMFISIVLNKCLPWLREPVRNCILSACSAFYYDFFWLLPLLFLHRFFFSFSRKYNESSHVPNGRIAGWCSSSSIFIINAGLAIFSKRPIPSNKVCHALYSPSTRCCAVVSFRPTLAGFALKTWQTIIYFYVFIWLADCLQSLLCVVAFHLLFLWRSICQLKLASVKTDEDHLDVWNEFIVLEMEQREQKATRSKYWYWHWYWCVH